MWTATLCITLPWLLNSRINLAIDGYRCNIKAYIVPYKLKQSGIHLKLYDIWGIHHSLYGLSFKWHLTFGKLWLFSKNLEQTRRMVIATVGEWSVQQGVHVIFLSPFIFSTLSMHAPLFASYSCTPDLHNDKKLQGFTVSYPICTSNKDGNNNIILISGSRSRFAKNSFATWRPKNPKFFI